VRVALDADNEPLRCGVEEKPAMIKPNQHEFTRLIGKHCETAEEILEAGQTLIRDKGIEIVLVSMGSEGLVLFNHEEAYHAVSPQVEVQSTIGSGDSAMAAFLLGWDRGEALEECARMSAAAGAATARSPGVELIRKHDYEEILPQVSSRRLELPS
jgi:fructose-1-phosphate kinase PfkB-like protein